MRETLPAYMVPSLFATLDELPLTPNGKVDRQRLPEPGASAAPAARRARVAPEGPVEEAIAEVWQNLLGVTAVDARDNFFELGGHSLLAMEAVALVEERVGVRLDPRELFFKSLRQLGVAGGTT